MEKNYVIYNGGFTTAGNFSGYTAKGVRVHIFQRQMNALGLATDADVKFPLYTIATEKPMPDTIDALTGESTPNAPRLTALSVFKTEDDAIGAHVSDGLFDIKVKKAVKQSGLDAGLSESEMANILSFSA